MSLFLSLEHLTKQRRICTVLVNDVADSTGPTGNRHRRRSEEDISLFPTTRGKPALGRSFAYLVDLSLFLSIVPRNADKVQHSSTGHLRQRPAGQHAHIAEVLKDRNGLREGRWAAFDVERGLAIVSIDPRD